MNTKERLIEKINSIDNAQVLEEIDRWITSLVEVASAEQYTEKELDAVREGYEQFKAGDTISRQKANQVFDQWLKEK